ncbi:MAG TPA: bifunctional molybdenum cofactor guanylyltransferase MobA/molybdopterin-guanine dinucleotide biosynthesis adaptor protein MobB [Spirochaetia bacterium]|nr:bifunctional molybdenum cofactor guanylyltransferase MobA/molybdopterin-guanine dinucleotide biosynthesis adaptor protein MobB [Spirochaetia bacterium]
MTSRPQAETSKTRDDRHGRPSGDSPVFYFSPYELAFAGSSGSGKTTLITGLIDHFTPDYRVGYVKHDAHRFDMDREGKDSYRASASGAYPVLINDEHHWAILSESSPEADLQRTLFQDVDFVFAEGFRHSDLAKIVLIDKNGEIRSEIRSGKLTNVKALVVDADSGAEPATALRSEVPGMPVFSIGDIRGIADFILRLFAERSHAIPLYGLVLNGGKSTRMRRDKGEIAYHGEPQVAHAFRLLERFCSKVYVSVRDAERGDESAAHGLPQLSDRFIDFGPMSGILTALHTHPQTAWVVLGCDMPFITEATIGELLTARDPLKLATAFDSSLDGLPEPLCAVYEPGYRRRLHQLLAEGRTCPRKALVHSHVRRLTLSDPDALRNINSPEEYEEAMAVLADRTKESRGGSGH